MNSDVLALSILTASIGSHRSSLPGKFFHNSRSLFCSRYSDLFSDMMFHSMSATAECQPSAKADDEAEVGQPSCVLSQQTAPLSLRMEVSILGRSVMQKIGKIGERAGNPIVYCENEHASKSL